jgi:peptidoglycan-associated lipoprotein
VCDANKCVPKPECVNDGQCGEGRKCQGKKCVVAEARTECRADNDCPSGQGCEQGKCVTSSAVSKACQFAPVRFEFNEFNLTSASQQALGQYADCIKKGNLRFTLGGHADERGTDEYNMVLSQKRASSVRKYLTELGVKDGTLDVVGFGEHKPMMNGATEEAWSANRRVEFNQR